MRAFASEFPNDNEALHDGAIWRNEEPVGLPTAHPPTLPVHVPVPALSPPPELDLENESNFGPIEIVDSLIIDEPEEVVPAPLESEVVLSSKAALAFVEAVEIPPPPRVPDIAAIEAAPEPAPSVDPYAAFLGVLVDAASAVGHTVEVAVLDAAFAADPVAVAWRAILHAESEDFTLCATTLDEWASTTLAAVLGAPAKATVLRRELRARGVAAFGLVLEAA
jgi:hypothetical protein